MADEAVVTIVARMRDEASPKMQNLGKTTQQTTAQMFNMQVAMVAAGSAMSALGSLAGRMDSPMAKMASNFLITGGAILTTVSAIGLMLPHLRSLIAMLRNLAIAQAVLKAFQGPWGWAQIAIGAGVAAGATAGILALTGNFPGQGSRGGGGSVATGGTRQTTVSINSQAFTGSQADARKFGSHIKRITESETRIGR